MISITFLEFRKRTPKGFFFFFQAEDGIRDKLVTGVQTCALPICERGRSNVVELDWWQSAERGRWKITCLPSQHWSRRLGIGTNRSLWCAWLLDSGVRRYFF